VLGIEPPCNSADVVLSAADYRSRSGSAHREMTVWEHGRGDTTTPSSRDAMPSPGSIECGTVTGLILERLESPRVAPVPAAGTGDLGHGIPSAASTESEDAMNLVRTNPFRELEQIGVVCCAYSASKGRSTARR
jgi:hypothetical protein